MPCPMIAGLYPYTRGNVMHPPKITLEEIPLSLRINPSYCEDLLVLAGDKTSADQLTTFGLRVYRVFNDAPIEVHRDTAHLMKHWMCLWALREFGEFLWVDWDTVLMRHPDEEFWEYCRRAGTPKFIHIPGYWATVNCGVYYAGKDWLPAMERSFEIEVSEPNDELLWTNVLPADVRDREEFWWGERAVNIWTEDEFDAVTNGTYFAHVRHLEWAERLRSKPRTDSSWYLSE